MYEICNSISSNQNRVDRNERRPKCSSPIFLTKESQKLYRERYIEDQIKNYKVTKIISTNFS